MKSKHIVEYIGMGVWTGNDGNTWDGGETHIFGSDLGHDEFLDGRQDLKFMKEYGQMKVTTVSVDETPPADTPPEGIIPPADILVGKTAVVSGVTIVSTIPNVSK